MGFLSAVALAAGALTVGAPLVLPADAASATSTFVPVHKILSSPRGVLTLPDGRQLMAKVYGLGGCTVNPSNPTGNPRGSASSNFTLFLQNSGAPCTLQDLNGVPTYVGFQAIRVTANGFKFTADLTLEDVDANTKPAADGPKGWRETMSSLALSDGSLVRPDVSVAPGALVAVKDYAIASSSLAEAGWTGVGAGAIPMQGISYDNWTRIENIGSGNAEPARGFLSYTQGIDDLLVFYGLTQPEAGNPSAGSAAFMSAIEIPAGCQCASGAAGERQVVLPTETVGRCTLKSRPVTPYGGSATSGARRPTSRRGCKRRLCRAARARVRRRTTLCTGWCRITRPRRTLGPCRRRQWRCRGFGRVVRRGERRWARGCCVGWHLLVFVQSMVE